MAIPFTQQVASTYDAVINERNRGADQWSDTSALNLLEELGGVKRVAGGATPSVTLDYRQNQGGDFLSTDTTATSTSKTEVLTQSSPSWATLVVPSNWSVTDEELNSDTNAKVPLIASIVDNQITTHDYMIESGLFATTGGTDGFQTFVDLFTADGTGTVQGIISGTETWWMSQFKDKASDTGATLLADYNTLYFSCCKGALGKQPNVIIANSTVFGTWLAANQANQRFLDTKEVRTMGSPKSAYHINARYIFSSVLTTSQNDAFFFNTSDTFLAVVKSAFRKRRAPVDFSNALMVNMKVFSILQLVTRNRSRGGLLFTT
jgi:hypothetical protein